MYYKCMIQNVLYMDINVYLYVNSGIGKNRIFSGVQIREIYLNPSSIPFMRHCLSTHNIPGMSVRRMYKLLNSAESRC